MGNAANEHRALVRLRAESPEMEVCMTWLSLLTNKWVQRVALVLALIGAFIWYRSSLIAEGEAREQAKVAQAVAEQKALADAQTANMEEVKNEAIAKAAEEAKRNAVAADRARSELDRLRKQTGSSLDLSKSSDAACAQYATAATDVLNECGSALVEMAQKADGHVTDIKALTGSWPTFEQTLEAQVRAITKGK
jgi:hypothetical protein